MILQKKLPTKSAVKMLSITESLRQLFLELLGKKMWSKVKSQLTEVIKAGSDVPSKEGQSDEPMFAQRENTLVLYLIIWLNPDQQSLTAILP